MIGQYKSSNIMKDNVIYEAIVRNSPNGIVVIDQDLVVVEFNDSAESLTGIKKAIALNKHFVEILPQLDLAFITTEGTGDYRCAINGKELYIKKVLVNHDNMSVIVLIMHDLSEVIKMATEIEKSKHVIDELQLILEGSFDGFLVTDGDGNVLMINKSYERITDLKKEELLGKNMRDLINPVYMKNSVAFLVIEEKRPISMTHTTRHGKNIIVTGMPLFDEKGQIYRVVINARDISEIYELKQELLKSKEMEKLYFQQLANQDEQTEVADKIIVVSEMMKEIFSLAKKICQYNTTVLVLGESGAGKEEVAKYIHGNSLRKSKPFVTINCGAIPENLLESELFGYEKGAFTGAGKYGKEGLFETAKGGTLFLDEIGELPLNLQVKLLRFLENREITRVGGIKPIYVDVRMLAATNKDLKEMVLEKKFREDLFYRLNVVQIRIPPLRERIEDIAPLCMHFISLFNIQYGQNKKLTYDVIKELEAHEWEGNIRELKNVVERMVVISNNEYLQISDLPWYNRSQRAYEAGHVIKIKRAMPLNEAIETLERQILNCAMKEYKTSRKIAEALKIDQSTVVRKMSKYGVRNEEEA